MCRAAVNMICFFLPFLGMVVLGLVLGGCSNGQGSTWANGLSKKHSVMPVALGDRYFSRWTQSSPL